MSEPEQTTANPDARTISAREALLYACNASVLQALRPIRVTAKTRRAQLRSDLRALKIFG